MPDSQKKLVENPDPLVVGATGTGALLFAMMAAVGGWIGYSALKVNHAMTLPAAIDAERFTFASAKSGVLSYYRDRSATGRPLVLVHGVSTFASSYGVRPLFERYRGRRPVYALDLPGFGFSERTRRVYTSQLYVNAIIDFVSSQPGQPEPVDCVAVWLSSEFVAQAAIQRPDLFRSLTFIAPSGFATRPAAQRDNSEQRYRLLTFPLWSQALFDTLVSRFYLNYTLKRKFYGRPDQGLIAYAYRTAHQPGAKNAPIYFLSGKLTSPDAYEALYTKLSLPVHVIYGPNGKSFDRLPKLAADHTNWHLSRITPARELPQFERPDETVSALDTFWNSLG